MLRITQTPKSTSIVELKLEGEIVSEWIPLLRQQCESSLREGRKIALDFSEVRFVDCRAVDMLMALDRERIRIIRCPQSIEDMINECRRLDEAPDR